MSTKVTMIDTAYTYLSRQAGEIAFGQLWRAVSEEMQIPEEKLSRKKRQLYSELMEDHRFAALTENMWDLRSRRKFDEVSHDASLTDDSDEETEEFDEQDQPVSRNEEDYN